MEIFCFTQHIFFTKLNNVALRETSVFVAYPSLLDGNQDSREHHSSLHCMEGVEGGGC